MRYASRSDQGKVRPKNEDFVLVDAERSIFLLADGMGGEPGGEVASRVAVEAAHQVLQERLGETADADVPRVLAEAFAAAHAAVYRQGIANEELVGLGTTLDVVVLRGRVAWYCHVGDGRIYLVGKNGQEKLSIDDNYAGVLTGKGVKEELVPAWARHVLTQAVGVSDELYPEIRERRCSYGDILVICSDGLTGSLPENLIGAVLRDFPEDLEGAAETLVRVANEQGGSDNISVILVAPDVQGLPQIEMPLLPG